MSVRREPQCADGREVEILARYSSCSICSRASVRATRSMTTLAFRLLLRGLVPILIAGCAVLPFSRRDKRPVREDFQSRIERYMDLHESLADKYDAVLESGAQPEVINAARRTLSAALVQARANAKRGDLFTPNVERYFRDRIRAHLHGMDGITPTFAITEVQPRAVRIGVNAIYPQDVPVPTMPPGLLEKLPPLPDELQYRVVHGALILLDTHARVIVDYIPDVLPHPRTAMP